MARLNNLVDSEDEFPELSAILAKGLVIDQKHEPQSDGLSNDTRLTKPFVSKIEPRPKLLPTDRRENTKANRPLKVAHVNSLLLSFQSQAPLSPRKGVISRNETRPGPRNQAGRLESQDYFVSVSKDSSDLDDVASDHMSDFIVPDSDSDSDEEYEDTGRQDPLWSKYQDERNESTHSPSKPSSQHHGKANYLGRSQRSSLKEAAVAIEPAQQRESLPTTKIDAVAASGTFEDRFGDPNSRLKFSPPRLRSPSKSPPVNGAVTSAAIASKPKLRSPTKRPRIPPSPHRPSIDAFWRQEVINDWNDLHSPKKMPISSYARNLYSLVDDDENYLSPCETGRLSPSKSHTKGDKQTAERRNKAFNEKKYGLAACFLKELDQTITNGQIGQLAESTGGVRLVWSKKLQSTAGRANWKREAIRAKDTDGTVSTTTYRHHASIELAEKVIDDEDRLVNTIAHEYCHLLNFMISNIKENPHGKEFKSWARKCSTAFAHRGVNVTTKHTYEISYKYIWACSRCGIEYKRHSKSIDPRRHSCGKCKEKLIQVKPVPRAEGKGMSEYQKFVKKNFAQRKKERPGMSMGEVMALLGKEFREIKVQKNEIVAVEEELPENKSQRPEEQQRFDCLSKKLDFLDLGTG
ncbi:MAG: hypothetical protein Q9201_005814 [Fulgogasparrea decipioides]